MTIRVIWWFGTPNVLFLDLGSGYTSAFTLWHVSSCTHMTWVFFCIYYFNKTVLKNWKDTRTHTYIQKLANVQAPCSMYPDSWGLDWDLVEGRPHRLRVGRDTGTKSDFILTCLGLLMGNMGTGVVLSLLCGWQLGRGDNSPWWVNGDTVQAGHLVLMKIKSFLPRLLQRFSRYALW